MTRPLTYIIVIAWAAQMAALVDRSYGQASRKLATDLARYGSDAQWRGVYYRGEKIGFTVSQVVPLAEGYELQEDGEIQMSLLGAITAARLRTTARVDPAFRLQSFEFSLDPGTGPTEVRGEIVPGGRVHRLQLSITTAGATRTEERTLDELPTLTLNMARRLADLGLAPGATHRWMVFDPATLRNAPALVRVGQRELVRTGETTLPAFKVETEFVGLRTTAWITDTGEIVREESPLGLLSVRESPERATGLAVPSEIQTDLLEASAVVPVMMARIDEPRDVQRVQMRLEGVDLSRLDLEMEGVGQTFDGTVVEIHDQQTRPLGPPDPDAADFLAPEPFIESDDPAIRAEAEKAIQDATDPRVQAERLTRYVNALLEKKPTVSLPSAREVLRTRIGDCNEHTALYVAMARAIGLPSRIAVGLSYVRGAFYYHAWPEVYLTEEAGSGWFAVDPTLNQFPADATHLRLTRGGLDRQAVILPLMGQLRITVLEVDRIEGAMPVLVGGPEPAGRALGTTIAAASQTDESCWCWWRR